MTSRRSPRPRWVRPVASAILLVFLLGVGSAIGWAMGWHGDRHLGMIQGMIGALLGWFLPVLAYRAWSWFELPRR